MALGSFDKKLPVTWESHENAIVWAQDGLVPLQVDFGRMHAYDTFTRHLPPSVPSNVIHTVVFSYNGSYDELSKLGQPTAVLAAVARSVKQYLARKEPLILAFTAEPKRARVYARMARRIDAPGYTLYKREGDYDFSFALVKDSLAWVTPLTAYGFYKVR